MQLKDIYSFPRRREVQFVEPQALVSNQHRFLNTFYISSMRCSLEAYFISPPKGGARPLLHCLVHTLIHTKNTCACSHWGVSKVSWRGALSIWGWYLAQGHIGSAPSTTSSTSPATGTPPQPNSPLQTEVLPPLHSWAKSICARMQSIAKHRDRT